MTCPHHPIQTLVDGGCVLCWKERCEKVELEYRDCKAALSVACKAGRMDYEGREKAETALETSARNGVALTEQNRQLEDRAEKAEAAAAEMRDALVFIAEYWNGNPGEAANNAAEACQMEADFIIKKTNIGQGFIPPDKARKVVSILEQIASEDSEDYTIRGLANMALDQLKDTQ